MPLRWWHNNTNNTPCRSPNLPTIGLRPRIAILLLLPLAILAGLAQWVLQRDTECHLLALEQAEALGNFQRVRAAVDGQAQNLSGVLRSWSNWTALYDHAIKPDPTFRQEELTTDALVVAQFDWLLQTDSLGRITEQVEVPRSDGTSPITHELRGQLSRYQGYFSQAGPDLTCGFVSAGQQLSLVCHTAQRRSDGTGDYVGLVVIGRWIDPEMLVRLGQQTGQTIHLGIAAHSDDVRAVSGGQLFGEDDPGIERLDDRLVMRTPAYSLLGLPVGELRVESLRRDMTEANQRLAAARRLMVALVILSGVLLVVLLDQLVVKRLARLRHELAAVMAEGQWHGSVTPSGRDEIGELAGFFNQLLAVVRRQMGELHDLSTTDALTDLPNRRAFDQRLQHLLARHTRQGSSAALVVFDVDHFKRYNDALGHPAGDEALKAIARCLRSTTRRRLDMPARLGGEEFGVLLEDADTDEALGFAEAVRKAIEALAMPHPDHPDLPHISVSGGVATFRPADTPEALYQRADDALYAAKQAGRNRIMLAA